MSLISLIQVSKEYQPGCYAVQNISLNIQKGELVALAGPSGSGKTTLLNMIAGLDLPSFGMIEVVGVPIGNLSADQLCRFRQEHFGFVFQSYNLFPVLTTLENVEFPLALRNLAKRERESRALKMLEAVGLKGLERRFPSQLSGGQQQRVAIARALVAEPKVVFADEPTANLDSKTARNLMDLFILLNHTYQTTFLISSHDPEVLNFIPRVITLKDGQVADLGSAGGLRHPRQGSLGERFAKAA